MKALAEVCAQLIGHFVLGERAIHAPQPFVALARSDRERQVSRAKTRVAVSLDVDRRPTGPPGQVEMELLARRLETLGMQGANRCCLGRAVDQIVEAIDQAPDAGVAAEELKWSGRLR